MIFRLKEARKLKGLSLKEAAKGLNKTEKWLRKFEKGELGMDSEHLIIFAKFYGVSTDYLVPNPNRPKIELTNIHFHKSKHI